MDSTPKFYCRKCDFKCNKKSDYTRHMNTKKHKNKCQEQVIACGTCGKTFNNRTTLWRHKQACIIVESSNTPDQMISELTNTNKQLLQSVNEVVVRFTHLHNVMMSQQILFDTVINNVKSLLDERTKND